MRFWPYLLSGLSLNFACNRIFLTYLQSFMTTILFYFCIDFQSVFKWVYVYHRSLVLEPTFYPQRKILSISIFANFCLFNYGKASEFGKY